MPQPQKLEPLEKEAADLLVEAAGIQYGDITIEIQVEAGKRRRTRLSVTKAVVDKYEH
jgi:hypothetical protein